MEELRLPTTLSHYRIVSKLGAGGMGEVYLAQDMSELGRMVALKTLPGELAGDKDRLQRFTQEARTVSNLNHPNILTVYEFGQSELTSFIATEYVDGVTLRQHFSGRHLKLVEVLDLLIQIVAALNAAHEAGVAHRDLKPENVMVRKDHIVKVLDFGLAKPSPTASLNSIDSEAGTKVMVHTQPGVVMGTVSYMSPEQSEGKGVDQRTDLWSAGVVLYEMLTGVVPFQGKDIHRQIIAIQEQEAAQLSQLVGGVPERLEEIVAKCLAKEKDERYQTAKDLLIDLRNLRRKLEVDAEIERTVGTSGGIRPATQAVNVSTAGSAAALNSQPTFAPTPPNSLAVLPFVNIGRDPDIEYFSDGLAEELLNVLSKISGLRVAARTSAFSFKGKSTTISEIGQSLHVSSVVEGSIRMSGRRMRISVQLVKVDDGYQLWSDTYDRMMDDIFAVQDDIAQSVVEGLRSHLLGEEAPVDLSRQVIKEVAQATKGRSDNPEAQRLMLLGRYFLDRTTPEDAVKAIRNFRDAVDLDPNFALCWAELGRAYAVQAGKAWVAVDEGFRLSREATERALELEPELAEGYAQLGRIRSAYDWDLRGSLAAYARALELAPGSSLVMDGASILELKLGRFDRALQLSRQVLTQDPISGAVWHNLGLICHSAGLVSEAEKAFRRALELSPQRLATTAMLALVLAEQGRGQHALEVADREPDLFWRLWALAILYHLGGETDQAERMLTKIIDEHSDGDAYQIAEIYAVRGETNNAYKWLERAVAERDPGVNFMRVNPRFRSLHSDPRWVVILKKIGFENPC